MTTTMNAADKLTTAVRELEAVFNSQGEQLAETREQIAESRKRFNDMMESMRSGLKPGAPIPKEALNGPFSQDTVRKQSVESNELSLRWERSLCDAYDALIALARYPDQNERISRISHTLRDIRLLQIEGRLSGRENSPPPVLERPPHSIPDENTIMEVKVDIMEQVSKWSEARIGEQRRWYDDTIQRTGFLIQKLVMEAGALNESLSDTDALA